MSYGPTWNSHSICLKGFNIRQKSYYKCYKLKSKEAYLGGDSHLVSRVSWGPGGVLVSTKMAGTRGSRGTFIFFNFKIKIISKTPLVFVLHSTVPTVGFEPRPLWPVVFSYPVLFPLSHPGQHTMSCSELLLLLCQNHVVFYIPLDGSLDFSMISLPSTIWQHLTFHDDFFHPVPLNRGCFLL